MINSSAGRYAGYRASIDKLRRDAAEAALIETWLLTRPSGKCSTDLLNIWAN
jgi:hypothetical protein